MQSASRVAEVSPQAIRIVLLMGELMSCPQSSGRGGRMGTSMRAGPSRLRVEAAASSVDLEGRRWADGRAVPRGLALRVGGVPGVVRVGWRGGASGAVG